MKRADKLLLGMNAGIVLLGGVGTAIVFRTSRLYYSGEDSSSIDELIVIKGMLFTLVVTLTLSGLIAFLGRYSLKRARMVMAKCLIVGLVVVLIVGPPLTMIVYHGPCEVFGPRTAVCLDEKAQYRWPPFPF